MKPFQNIMWVTVNDKFDQRELFRIISNVTCQKSISLHGCNFAQTSQIAEWYITYYDAKMQSGTKCKIRLDTSLKIVIMLMWHKEYN